MAVYWYREAANRGHDQAQNPLGILYYNGDGVPEDLVQALVWLLRAAGQGNADAQANSKRIAETMDAKQIAEEQILLEAPLPN